MTASASPAELGRGGEDGKVPVGGAQDIEAGRHLDLGSAAHRDSTTRPMWPLHPEMMIFCMAAPYSRPMRPMAWRSVSRFLWEMSHRGRRREPASMPIRFMAALMGMGLTSMNRASIRSI